MNKDKKYGRAQVFQRLASQAQLHNTFINELIQQKQ
jgi:hypothetical protein